MSRPEQPFDAEDDEVLADCLGTRSAALRSLPAPRASSYGVRRVAVDLPGGRTLDVLVKSFDVSPHAVDVALRRGARERYVYETVLAGRELGTARLHGVVWDDDGGRHWLLLEYVGGHPCYALENRIAAAAWLGRLHAGVAGHVDEFARSGRLLSYDGSYFRDTAERARQAVESRSRLLRRRLDTVLTGYDALAEAMASGRPTLVHGSCRSANVLVDARRTPVRVCPLDWELAATGPPLHDLAFLADRYDRAGAARLCRTYAAQVAAAGLPVPGTARMLEEIEHLRLHKVLRSLSRSAERADTDDVVARFVDKAEAIRRRLGRGPGAGRDTRG